MTATAARRVLLAVTLCLTASLARPNATLAQAEDKPSSAAEATKAKQRAILRQLKVVPRASDEPPNLDDVILDWSPEGYVTAARVAAADGVQAPAGQATSLAPLRALPKLKSVELIGIVVKDLRALGGLPKLEHLKLVACDGLKPIAEVSRLRGLQRVVISNVKVGDTSGLRALTRVTEIDLIDTDLSSIAFVTAMPKLGRLVVSGSAGLKDVKAIAKLKWLRELDLARTGVTDLSPLAGLQGLKSLKVPKGLDMSMLDKLVADGCKIEEI